MEDLEFGDEQVDPRTARIAFYSKVTIVVLMTISVLIVFFGMYGAWKFTQRNHDRETLTELQRQINRNESLLESRSKEVEQLKDQITLMHQAHDMENLLTFVLDPDQKDKIRELDKFVQQYKALQKDKSQ